MTIERWHEVIELFEQAMDQPIVDRERFVNDAAADADLRDRVLAMVRADVHTHRLLDATPDAIASAVLEESAARLQGLRLGPYTLLREVGRGGMGTVFLAEREDVDKRVALKLMSGGLASRERIERFLLERRVLAQLEHPNIARLLDAGVAPDGTPWLAMEYVDGQPIDAWCDARRLDVSDRLVLFEKVCDAVAYAHRNLVVHRDIKPSNILVTAEGEPRLVDFGIAKLLDATDPTGTLTHTTHPMTPEYASPEQLRGEAITTASDVYQLGVLLFELLTGRRPHRVAAERRHEIERAILDSDAPRPSLVVTTATDEIAQARATTPDRLRRRIGGDLDNIVLMALRPEPALRYASAQQLREEIRRHQSNQPVIARPATVRYRTSRFVRRNRVVVAAAAIVFLSLVGATVGMTWQARLSDNAARIAAEQRDRANIEAAKAEQVAAFLTDLFQQSDPDVALGRDITARELLARGAQRLGEDGELAAQPLVRAELLNVLGRVYRDLGSAADARKLLEEGLRLRRAHLETNHADLAESLSSLGALAVNENRTADASAYLQEALAIRRVSPTPDSGQLAAALHNLAGVHMQNAAYDTAEALLREAVRIRRGLDEENTDNLEGSLQGLGVAMSRQGKLAAADSFLREVLRVRRARLDPRHPELARTIMNVGALKIRQREYAAAEPYLREAIGIWRVVLGKHTDLATALNNLGSSLESQGELEEAESAYRESLEMKRELIAGDHASIAFSLNNLGLLLEKRGDIARAEALLLESLAMRRRLQGDNHPEVADALYNLGLFNVRRGRDARAERDFTRALEIRRERVGTANRQTLLAALGLAQTLDRRGDNERARSLAAWIIEAGTPALTNDDSVLVSARRLLGSAKS
jgi:serine/threonine-protein kinase